MRNNLRCQNHSITAWCQTSMSPMHFIKHYKHQNWNFEKLLGLQVFKHHNCDPMQSSLTLSMFSSFLYLLYYLYLVSFHVWADRYFYVCFAQFGGTSHGLNISDKFCYTSPLSVFFELQPDFSFSSSLICLLIKGTNII